MSLDKFYEEEEFLTYIDDENRELMEKFMAFMLKGHTKLEACKEFKIDLLEVEKMLENMDMYDPIMATKIQDKPYMVFNRLWYNPKMKLNQALNDIQLSESEWKNFVSNRAYRLLYKNRSKANLRLYLRFRCFIYSRSFQPQPQR